MRDIKDNPLWALPSVNANESHCGVTVLVLQLPTRSVLSNGIMTRLAATPTELWVSVQRCAMASQHFFEQIISGKRANFFLLLYWNSGTSTCSTRQTSHPLLDPGGRDVPSRVLVRGHPCQDGPLPQPAGHRPLPHQGAVVVFCWVGPANPCYLTTPPPCEALLPWFRGPCDRRRQRKQGAGRLDKRAWGKQRERLSRPRSSGAGRVQ